MELVRVIKVSQEQQKCRDPGFKTNWGHEHWKNFGLTDPKHGPPPSTRYGEVGFENTMLPIWVTKNTEATKDIKIFTHIVNDQDDPEKYMVSLDDHRYADFSLSLNDFFVVMEQQIMDRLEECSPASPALWIIRDYLLWFTVAHVEPSNQVNLNDKDKEMMIG